MKITNSGLILGVQDETSQLLAVAAIFQDCALKLMIKKAVNTVLNWFRGQLKLRPVAQIGLVWGLIQIFRRASLIF